MASTLRSVPLSGSRTARHRVLLTKAGSSFEEFRVHRTVCLSRRLDRASSTVLPRSPCVSPTSGLSSTGESVARVRRFRRTRLDAPMGFWIDTFRACHAFPRWTWLMPIARCGSYRRVSRRPRATKKASILGLSGSESSRCSRRPEGRHSPVRTASNPKAAALPFPLPIHPCGRLTGSLPGSRSAPKDEPRPRLRASRRIARTP